MANRSTVIEFKSRDTVPGDEKLWLEQEEYPEDEYLEYGCVERASEQVPITSVASIKSYMIALQECASNCNEQGDFVARIRVYTEPFGMAYTPRITHGEIGPKLEETTEFVDQVKWRLDKTVKLSKTLSDIQVTWEGPVMNSLGEEIPPPNIHVGSDGKTLTADFPVYGVCLVKGIDRHYVHEVTIPQREEGEFDPDKPESIYDATFMAFYSNKVADIDVDPPPIRGSCDYRVKIQMGDGPGDSPDGSETCWKRVITINTCTGEIESDEKVQVSCPEV